MRSPLGIRNALVDLKNCCNCCRPIASWSPCYSANILAWSCYLSLQAEEKWDLFSVIFINIYIYIYIYNYNCFNIKCRYILSIWAQSFLSCSSIILCNFVICNIFVILSYLHKNCRCRSRTCHSIRQLSLGTIQCICATCGFYPAIKWKIKITSKLRIVYINV